MHKKKKEIEINFHNLFYLIGVSSLNFRRSPQEQNIPSGNTGFVTMC